MNTIKYYTGLFFILFLCSVVPLSAQFNIKIGYGIGYSDPSVNNAIIGRFKGTNPHLNGLKELHFLHSIQAGLRYRIGNVGLEATWMNKFNSSSASGISAVSGDNVYRKLSFRYGTYSLGMDIYLSEWVGLGASIDLDNMRYRMQTVKNGSRTDVVNEWGMGSHFFVSLNIPGNDILTLSIKPYVQVPWSGVSVFGLEEGLNPEFATTVDPTTYQERYLNFGIMLVFYNGYW